MREAMTGLELARGYYAACKPVFMRKIPDIMAQAAAGLAGEGSECFGCDDATSRDHDFGAAFCLWIPELLLKENLERIEAAFAQLPQTYENFPSRLAPPARQGRVGPIPLEKFYKFFTGLTEPPATWRQWLSIPEYQLAAVVNGEVFEDNSGLFSRWRRQILAYYPRDVWLKKLSASAMRAAQAGQYNLPRALTRGDGPSAMLAAARYAENIISLVFLLNRRYMPFYKWAPCLGRKLPLLGDKLGAVLDALAGQPLRDRRDLEIMEYVEDLCVAIAGHLRDSGLTRDNDPWLWALGPQIMAHVENAEIRAMNLLQD